MTHEPSGADQLVGLPTSMKTRLAAERGVWVMTNRPSGPPHVTPMWFIYDAPSSTWWISTGANSVKARNITKRPHIALALEDGRHPVVAEGIASIHHQPFPPAVVTAFAQKYDGWDITIPYRPGTTRVLLEIPTRRWLFPRD